VALLLCYSCSYSEIVNGTTTNAAGTGLTWKMTGILPAATGLTVDGVIYQYTAVKNTKDAMVVSVQNANAIDTGYIFRSQDDWTGRPGNSITKVVPVDNIAGKYWGDGSISVSGQGQVTNPSVVYKYRYDTCYNPLSDPSCPGYAQAMLDLMASKAAEPVDPLSNKYVKDALESKPLPEDEDKKKDSAPKSEKKVEKVAVDKKAVIINSLISAEDAQKASRLEMLNNIPGFSAYSINMAGGVYNDVIRYSDKKLPDSRNGRSLGVAQEKLHGAMVDSQYNK
jgi:hypothetical protein